MKWVLYWNLETWLFRRSLILNQKWRALHQAVQLQGYHHHLLLGNYFFAHLKLLSYD